MYSTVLAVLMLRYPPKVPAAAESCGPRLAPSAGTLRNASLKLEPSHSILPSAPTVTSSAPGATPALTAAPGATPGATPAWTTSMATS
ncbi:hypothetical protein B0T25DRAFT_529228 [Lasiosphaeria hispida]|uniref:Uncharacterized protein n=1 Tax=Lasiosphaeria hispida TaxID=260671 RepID=A0AAJ0HWX1_9PEZI|nr:hypothetical protein B0T25DRAFT_529228 [Lasiosphaeria hispida]